MVALRMVTAVVKNPKPGIVRGLPVALPLRALALTLRPEAAIAFAPSTAPYEGVSQGRWSPETRR